MLGSIKKSRKDQFLEQYKQLYERGVKRGNIEKFNAEFYGRYEEKYYYGIPVGSFIRHFHPKAGFFSQCSLRGLMLSYGFPKEARIMHGYQEAVIFRDGDEDAEQCWVEYEGWCYDPTILARVEKKTYYRLMGVSNEREIYTRATRFRNKQYLSVYNGSIKDYLPNGPRREELKMWIPALLQMPQSEEFDDNALFRAELNAFLLSVDFDYSLAR